jgi:hypothetical protein
MLKRESNRITNQKFIIPKILDLKLGIPKVKFGIPPPVGL